MTPFYFKYGHLSFPSIKTITEGNIHERINSRYHIVRLREFLRNHPAHNESNKYLLKDDADFQEKFNKHLESAYFRNHKK